ncbi:hypothetical protein BGZ81_001878 [Podila clonocystis]|nr:hypothetical protein BGZ81_001878 [Podila clonocystis]
MAASADDVSSTSNMVDACSIHSEPCKVSTPSTTPISRPLAATEVSQNHANSKPLYMNPLPSITDRKSTTVSATATMMRSNSNESSGFRHCQHSAQIASANTIDNSVTPEYARTTVPKHPARALSVTLPSGPVECGCARHYKHPVISSVIPMPLALCFELLFSGMGAGQGDKLGCDTHRFKDGSTDIKITPWQSPSSLTPVDSIVRKWSDERRYLEYSVSFKVPMLAKTSTACFETQQVTEYSDFIILVHSESRTPNVPYGEYFSTVNQICMTWDSPGNTKIQCFTEVKFKKSIMWSGKVEAGSLEGSGGFYKELIRQLAELAHSPRGAALVEMASKLNTKTVAAIEVKLQRAKIATPSASSLNIVSTTAILPTEPAASPLSITHEPATPFPIQAPISYSTSGAALTMEPVELSRAQSLLSQQILRSQTQPLTLTLPLKSRDRASLVSEAGPKFEASTNDSMLSTQENKSPVSIFIQSLTSSVSPVLGVVGNEQVVATSAASAPLIESPNTESSTPTLPVIPPSAQTLLELLKKGLMLFNKSPSATALSITPESLKLFTRPPTQDDDLAGDQCTLNSPTTLRKQSEVCINQLSHSKNH